VGRVPVELGALVRTKGIFDGELVQAQLGRELVELLLRGSAQVHPHDGVGLLEALRDIGEGEPLRLKNPLSIHPGHGIAHEDSPPAPMGACVAPSSSLDYPPSVARRSGGAKQQSVVRQVCGGTDPVPELRQGERAPRPRSMTSRRPPSYSTTSRMVWRGTPGRVSRPAVQDRTRSHRIRRSCSDRR